MYQVFWDGGERIGESEDRGENEGETNSLGDEVGVEGMKEKVLHTSA